MNRSRQVRCWRKAIYKVQYSAQMIGNSAWRQSVMGLVWPDGRVYTLTYSATDGSGNKSTASTTVTVPHDQR
ncbi:MAG: hypothetical protein ABL858_09255 [Candidatus Nitrotoga sp.]